MTIALAGKVALVTGGSHSLGSAIAKRLARDGAAVALTYTSSPRKADIDQTSTQQTGTLPKN
jgi:3-oxoacyl-[acyl-carrier protein] reductase